MVELDVADEEHLASLADRVREHVDGVDGVLHSIGFAPASCLGGGFLDAPWDDVATAVQVSAYSLKSLAVATLPLFGDAGGSIVGLTFDARVAWPAYDWMGVAKAGLESTSRYLARELGPRQIRVNLIAAGPDAHDGRQEHPRLQRRSRTPGTGAPRWAGTTATPSRSRAASRRCCRTGSRRPPARSCTSTAASTRWVSEWPASTRSCCCPSAARRARTT